MDVAVTCLDDRKEKRDTLMYGGDDIADEEKSVYI